MKKKYTIISILVFGLLSGFIILSCDYVLIFHQPKIMDGSTDIPNSSGTEVEEYFNEAHGTTGLDMDFIDEYLGFSSGSYCDQSVQDGPYGDHYKVLTVRDDQYGLQTWSVHYLDEELITGSIGFSLRMSKLSSCTSPNYHYIKFRASDNTIAFQLRFNLMNNYVYYYGGSGWSLITILTSDEWYRYSIDYDLEAVPGGKFSLEIVKETTSSVVGTLLDKNYENQVPIEEVYIGTTVSHYGANSQWDDFAFICEVFDPMGTICRPNGDIETNWAPTGELWNRVDDNVIDPDPGDGVKMTASYLQDQAIASFQMDNNIGPAKEVTRIDVKTYGGYMIGKPWVSIYWDGEWLPWQTVNLAVLWPPYPPPVRSWCTNTFIVSGSQEDLDNLQVRYKANAPYGFPWSGYNEIDAFYCNITYEPGHYPDHFHITRGLIYNLTSRTTLPEQTVYYDIDEIRYSDDLHLIIQAFLYYSPWVRYLAHIHFDFISGEKYSKVRINWFWSSHDLAYTEAQLWHFYDDYVWADPIQLTEGNNEYNLLGDRKLNRLFIEITQTPVDTMFTHYLWIDQLIVY